MAKANLPSNTDILVPVPSLGDSGCYMPPTENPTGLTNTTFVNTETAAVADMNLMGIDVGGGSSVSPHDLAVLDAAVWYGLFPLLLRQTQTKYAARVVLT